MQRDCGPPPSPWTPRRRQSIIFTCAGSSWNKSRTVRGEYPTRRVRNVAWIPADFHVRDVVGDVRKGKGSAHSGHLGDFRGNAVQSAPPFLGERVVVFLQIAFESFDHAD